MGKHSYLGGLCTFQGSAEASGSQLFPESTWVHAASLGGQKERTLSDQGHQQEMKVGGARLENTLERRLGKVGVGSGVGV